MTHLVGTYTLDSTHTTIGFVVRHAMVTKVRGSFSDWDADITIADNAADSTVKVTVSMDSIDTGNTDRDAHVRGEDFFNTAQYPTMTFEATTFDIDESGSGTIGGDLTIKGVTKPVNLKVDVEGQAEDPYGNTRVGFEATATINRTDFGIDFNAPLKTGGVLISEEIKIEIEGSAIKN
ncbi:MAG: YceI family protein [Corynebacterium sp.]|nr:YceI family protein [Corynebacterium sp.]